MPRLASLLAVALVFVATAPGLRADALAPSVTTQPFGLCDDGPVTIYTLTNANGLKVRAMDFGATIVGVVTPDKAGHLDDIALGFDNPQTYAKAKLTFGSVGRVMNRIAQGQFTLNGHTFDLDKNAAPNTLHGGAKGFARQLWKGEIVSQNPPTVRFRRVSPDGEMGFPGTLTATATFSLTKDNVLRLQYEATTDQPTVVGLGSHTLFNLSGAGHGTILHDIARINASNYTPVDAASIPTGEIKPVAGTPLDFRQPTEIGSRFAQLTNKPQGYDFNYVLDHSLVGGIAAEVYDPVSGRDLQVRTSQPGMQFYTGNFFDGTLIGKGGVPYPQYCAFSCETQHFPDSPHHPNFPSVVLLPGKTYSATTEYKFSVKSSP